MIVLSCSLELLRNMQVLSPQPAELRRGQLLLSAPPFRPALDCPNFFIVHTAYGGLGHRMCAIAFAIALADGTNSAIVLEDALVDAPRGHDAAQYPFLRKLFNLFPFMTASEAGIFFDGVHFDLIELSMDVQLGEMRAVASKSVSQAVMQSKSSCRQVLLMPTGHMGCEAQDGKLEWCHNVGVTAAFERSRHVLSHLYLEGEYARMPLHHFHEVINAEAPTLAVVWHIRNDDIKLHGNDVQYWTNLVVAILGGLQQLRVHHYVISQYHIGPGDKDFGFLHSFPGFKWTALDNLAVDVASYHMSAADVLVHSGSSFSLVAGLVASDTQVSVYAPPKESKAIGDPAYNTFWLNGSIAVELDGNVPANNVRELSARAARRLVNKPPQWAIPL